ncbi:MAG: sodium/bile acid cotransporter 7 [Desulforhopalus sp.]|jgi:sodium/bile acid cotransporter 7
MIQLFKKNWFMVGLVVITILVVLDETGILVNPGRWLKNNHGPDVVIVLIFFLSGLALDTRQIREGISDVKGTLLALFLIFLVAPTIGYFFSLLPLEAGLLIGILLVASMPTTLSSGVVMTGSAGGNMAHSLLITIIANSLAVITIPVTLSILMGGESSQTIQIDQLPIMIKIATLVLTPLIIGIATRRIFGAHLQPVLSYTSTCNQLGILTIVWMALCGSRNAIISGLDSIHVVILVVFFFHLILVLVALYLTKTFKIAKGKRESVIFMGGQKTLPLSVILQVSLFPEFGIALVVCVVHHIVHLIMDAYLIGYLKGKKE